MFPPPPQPRKISKAPYRTVLIVRRLGAASCDFRISYQPGPALGPQHAGPSAGSSFGRACTHRGEASGRPRRASAEKASPQHIAASGASASDQAGPRAAAVESPPTGAGAGAVTEKKRAAAEAGHSRETSLGQGKCSEHVCTSDDAASTGSGCSVIYVLVMFCVPLCYGGLAAGFAAANA